MKWSWRLSDATPEQRAHWELIGDGQGVRWPGADEGLSAEGMLRGTPAKRPVRPQDKGVAPPPSEARAATTKLDSRFRGNDALQRSHAIKIGGPYAAVTGAGPPAQNRKSFCDVSPQAPIG